MQNWIDGDDCINNEDFDSSSDDDICDRPSSDSESEKENVIPKAKSASYSESDISISDSENVVA